MNDLSKAERFKKCLNCGSEEHRAADCKATRRKDLTQQEPKSKPQVAQVSQPASSALPHLSCPWIPSFKRPLKL